MSASAAKCFSLVFGVVYCVCFYMNWSLFRFYPETNAFSIQPRPDDGPAIAWYGWMAIAALVAGAVALVLPRRLGERLPNGVVWGVSVILVGVIFAYEKRWFF